MMAVSFAQAQTLKDEVLAIVESSGLLEKLLGDQPKASGEDAVDSYQNAVVSVAGLAVDNSKKILDLFNKFESGTTDLEFLIADANNLKESIQKEGSDFKDAQTKATAAAKRVADLGNEVATASPLTKLKALKKLKSSTSVLNFTKDCSTTLAKETLTQSAVVVKLISAITGKE